MTAVESHSGENFALPAALAERGFVLRPETEADIPFLCRLYASTRWDELALTDWTDAQKFAFADSQFGFQRHHYRTHYPTSEWGVLEVHGVPAGRLYVYRDAGKFEVLDIALLPQWRGRGIGTALMEWVCAQALAADQTVMIAVEKFNRAQTLYRRLGFREVANEGVYWFMEWRAAPDDGARLS
jgi:ribosomal protein S18 acetylase RimI-like enzyme